MTNAQTATEYTIMIRFTRSMADDLDVLGQGSATPLALAEQMARELQEVGYDDGAIAGSFQVESVCVAGTHFAIG